MDAREIMSHPRHSGRTKIANKLYHDYELYTTVNESKQCRNRDSIDDESLEAVAHYIMMHYEEKEKILTRKNKYKPKPGQYGLDTGLKRFGARGEAAVTKELDQFNNYDVFEPLFA